MQSLNNFIKSKKEEISLERTSKNTVARLVGVQESRSVRVEELAEGKFQLWLGEDGRSLLEGQSRPPGAD
jgi:hypothetical protein